MLAVVVTAVNRTPRRTEIFAKVGVGAHDDACQPEPAVLAKSPFFSVLTCHQILPMNRPSFDINVTPPSKM